MHPRNPYRSPPDFLALADAHPPLKPHIITTSKGHTIDFRNEAAQRSLTEAILRRDFGLAVKIPPGRLCPPVPNRLNYILWLQDVVDTVSLALGEDKHRPVRGLDVGTGASAVYPLLGCRMRSSWSFTATEVDDLSFRSACGNVQQNCLDDRITIVAANPAGPIFAVLSSDDVTYDFTMCNPPFYSSRDEVLQSAEAKEFGPNAVCTGADVEMITPGGEVAFVGRMVQESLALRGRCRWYTSMLGKMSSLTHIVQLLRENEIDNYAISELAQGQTRRWVIAWSFEDVRLPDSLARIKHGGTVQHLMPARNSLHQPLPQAQSVREATALVRSVLDSVEGLELRETGTEVSDRTSDALDVIVSAAANTWSRAARRKKRDAMEVESQERNPPQLVCRVRCGEREEAGSGDVGVGLVFDWLRGKDRGIFESFASHVERKVVAGLSARAQTISG